VLWFDEYYYEHEDYQFVRAERAAKREAALVIFAGTSFSVGVTDMVMRSAAHRGVPIYNVDPTPRVSHGRVHNIAAGAETVFPALCEMLGVSTS
jgi:NAD-dependent SIR2 family protein deacetylase